MATNTAAVTPRVLLLFTVMFFATNIAKATESPQVKNVAILPGAVLYAGETATLYCIGSGDPAPTFSWSRHSGALPAGAEVDGSKASLRNLAAEDSGVYICTVDNGVGRAATGNISIVVCPDLGDCATADRNENCLSWAKRGECERNPGFMNRNCRLSCGICIPGLPLECVHRGRGRALDTWECNDVTNVPDDVRSTMSLDNFYQKYLHAYGIPVLGSSIVPDEAIRRACYDVLFMLADRKDLRDSYYNYYGRAAIMAETEVTLDIPEHSNLDESYNTRARGLGATVSRPVSTGAEENVLCYSSDRYKSEDIFLHEFSHGIDLLGARQVMPSWRSRLQAAFNSAKAAGLWANTYADDTIDEYFAEGVQGYFDVNAQSLRPNGIHNHVNNRTELQEYDPTLYGLVKEIFPCGNILVKRCDPNYQLTSFRFNCFAEGRQRDVITGNMAFGITETPTSMRSITMETTRTAMATGSTPRFEDIQTTDKPISTATLVTPLSMVTLTAMALVSMVITASLQPELGMDFFFMNDCLQNDMPMTQMYSLPRPFWTCLLVIALSGTAFTQVAPDIEVISAWPSANLYYEESLTLTCHGGGDPAPTYSWTHDSGSLPARAVVDGSAGTLTLADVTYTDGGVFTCTADNGVGTATLNITVAGCPDVSTCPDSSSSCPGWANSGECESNPGYMLSNCRLSCGVCFPNLGAHCTAVRRGRSWDTWECYDVTTVPDDVRTDLNLDTSFYQKYLHAYGIPILGSSALPDDALRRACYDVLFMLADRKDVRDSYFDYYGRAAIMTESQVTLDIPEHSNLNANPYNNYRGIGGTVSRPVSSGAEENVLCYNTDPYKVEDIFIHEFAHGLDILGARKVISDFQSRLQTAYDDALANGRFANTYADDTRDEYWAEGVQSYFNVNHERDPPDGIHNHVNTRPELQAYDPALYAIIEEIFPCGNFPVKRCERDYASYTLKMDCFSENYQRETVVGTAVWGQTSTSTAATQAIHATSEDLFCNRFDSNTVSSPVIYCCYIINCDIKSNNKNTGTVHRYIINSGADSSCKHPDGGADSDCEHPDGGADPDCKHPDGGADSDCKYPNGGADSYCKHLDGGADSDCKYPDGGADSDCKHPDGGADSYCKHPDGGADSYCKHLDGGADSNCKHPDGGADSNCKYPDGGADSNCKHPDGGADSNCKHPDGCDFKGNNKDDQHSGPVNRNRYSWNYINDRTLKCCCHVHTAQYPIVINCRGRIQLTIGINYRDHVQYPVIINCKGHVHSLININRHASIYNCSCYTFQDQYNISDRLLPEFSAKRRAACSAGTPGTVRTTPTLVTRLVTTLNATESAPKPPGTDVAIIVAAVLGSVACLLGIAGAIWAVLKCMAAKTAVVAIKPA
uniref:ShKT domain-containing protein n=1 Tax=Branchiostoma floridae TaxID=7739 RepID=C3YIY7_BRAFL|eukprot:XP_002603850.1 hypothetical protein BRAFLDRAFT_129677 [Branchiostoma floridae]